LRKLLRKGLTTWFAMKKEAVRTGPRAVDKQAVKEKAMDAIPTVPAAMALRKARSNPQGEAETG
jgi:hypothetical protein